MLPLGWTLKVAMGQFDIKKIILGKVPTYLASVNNAFNAKPILDKGESKSRSHQPSKVQG